MKRILLKPLKQLFLLTAFGLLLILSCEKETGQTPATSGDKIQANKSIMQISGSSRGAIQVSGVSVLADAGTGAGQCDVEGLGATYALSMSGDFNGCYYIFIESYNCSPSGTYRETGRELFVGTYKGEAASFRTTYKFEAKYEGCNADGSYKGAEIFGRCQHPIVEGSGTGSLEGVRGQLNMVDNVDLFIYPYKGHIQFF